MNFKSLLSNFAAAFSAQFLAVIVSIFTTLLVPKLLGVTEYGYWQLFIFYASYVGVFSFGLYDGVYLINGGTSRKKIDKQAINSQYWFGICYQTIIALIIVLIALQGGFGPDREPVIICAAIYLPIQNGAYFLGYLLQAMNETKTWSFSTMLERTCLAIPVIILILLRVQTFEPYMYAYIFSRVCQVLYLSWHTRDFFSSGLEPLSDALKISAVSIRAGVKLMIANIASTLIIGVARFIIDLVWGIETFSQLSLSISCVNFFLAFSSQVSMVLFPALRQSNTREASTFYVASRDFLELFFPAMYLLYYPFVWLLGLWLPQYSEGLVYFAYMIPICLFDSQMQVVSQTMFKVRREEARLLRINVATALVSCALCVFSAFVLHSVHAVIASIVVSIALRSIYSEHVLNKEMNAHQGGIVFGEIVMTAIFLIATIALSSLEAAGVYAAAYAVFAFRYRQEMRRVVNALRGALRR